MAHNLRRRAHSPGQPAPCSGLYVAHHACGERDPQPAALRAGQVFPACEVCGEDVRFTLLRGAPYLFDDDDFSARDAETRRKRR